ncbi:MAG: DNA replication/repair protein RecF [Oscillospiraceae bacterium]|nr:DNA replication/repair protein RecF [Oscillospiraceae bacterium]
MIFRKIYLKNFRNIEEMELLPGEKVNIICGENAQGKTNLMEALWLFTGAKSFRQTKDLEFIRFGEEKANLKAEFFSENREQNAEISFSPSKSLKKNGIDIKSSAEYAGTIGGVVFSPSHMNLFRDGPKERRRLIDTSLCQLYPKYLSVLADYKKVLDQRNTVLKDARYHSGLIDMIDIYDEQLARLGGTIIRTRVSYCESLNKKAAEIYKGMSGAREEFFAEYITTVLSEDEHADSSMSTANFAQKFYDALQNSRNYDFEHGSTSVGPHRDDLEVTLDKMPVRSFGSQGQQRSCILSLKLGEAKMLGEAMGEPPLILLDDVMSELDSLRRDYILNSIGESQIFLTCCDKELFSGLEEGKVFIMQKGSLVQRELARQSRD